MARGKKEPSFEKDLEQLEAIVAALEEGGLSLDEALKRFEEGIKLARTCDKALKEAEKRIEILTKNAAGELETRPFGDQEEASEDRDLSDTQESEEAEENPANSDDLLF